MTNTEEKEEPNWKYRILMWVGIIIFFPAVLYLKSLLKKQEQRAFFLKNFRVEITKGLFWDTKKIIQREHPLTDEETSTLYKEINRL